MHKPKIYWLVSYPKSGNTWCRIFLSNYITDNDKPININELNDIPIVSARSFIDQFLGFDSSELTTEEIADFRIEALRKMNDDLEDIKIIKVHDSFPLENEHNFFLDDITAGVIYIVRNPFDVAVSLANHAGKDIDRVLEHMSDDEYYFSNPEEKMGIQFPQKLLSWSGHIKSWTERFKGKICLISYEDLCNNTEDTFAKLVRFIDLKYDADKLQKALRFSDFSALQQEEMKNGFREKSPKSKMFFREGKAGTWKKYLTDRQKEKIITDHYEVMLKLNYITEKSEVLV